MCACLQLRTYYFFEAATSEIRKRGIIDAYATSMAYVNRLDHASNGTNFLEIAPNHFPQALALAGIIIMKIINSSYDRYVDATSGTRAFNRTISMLRKCSIEDNDLRGRGTKILTQLWSLHQSAGRRGEQEPSLSRQG